MATKGEHEKPEAVEEHQPITKKVRLDVDAKVTEDVEKVTIDEGTDVRPEACASESAPTKQTEADMPAADADTRPEEQATEPSSADPPSMEGASAPSIIAAASASATTTASAPTEEKVTKPNTTGSAFGGFAAFSGKSGFAGFTSSGTSGGFGIKASSPGATFGDAATDKPSTSGFGSSGSRGFGTGTSTSSGFASFQSTSSVSFASFASTTTSTDGFGSTTSSADFKELDASVKKAEPVVPALTEAELANGEEDERILVEDYAEVGIGPLRVLSAKDASPSGESKPSVRLVMRRESYARGPGTKLLINARLSACLHCEKKAEKALLLTVLEAAEPDQEKEFTPVTYLMRFGAPEEMEMAADAASTS